MILKNKPCGIPFPTAQLLEITFAIRTGNYDLRETFNKV